MKRALIVQDDVELHNTVNLLDVVRRLYKEEAYSTFALSINRPHEELLGFFNHIVKVQDETVKLYDTIGLTDIIEGLHSIYQFDTILIPATPLGRMVAPRLAMRLHSGLVADVTDITTENGRLEIIRPAFSGKILAGIACKGTGPTMMSIRPNVFSYSHPPQCNTEITKYSPKETHKGKIQCLKRDVKEKRYDIRKSKVLIAGGGGVGKNFPQLETLGSVLGGEIAASRKLVDTNIASRDIQVGQSGKTVSPKLYIALGIDGAIQHVEGLRNVETIISVNTNRNAPIRYVSDIVVEGDALEFIEKLVARINLYKEDIEQ